MNFGTLAGDLGCFPFDHRSYLLQSDSRNNITGIRSLIEFGSPVRPLAHPVLYPQLLIYEAIPKYISRRTSYLQV